MSEIIDDSNKPQNELVVNFTKENFADMIINFLGKKETLKYRTESQFFEVTLHDIEQLYYLLEQKIAREDTLLIDTFSMELVYDDETSKEIHGIDNVSKYFENRSVSPIAVILEWRIILKFKDSKQVETQKIQIFIKGYEEEYVGILIEHTNQIWGTEVLNLFKDKVESFCSKEYSSIKFAKKIKNFLESGPLTNILTFAIIIFFIVYFTFSTKHNLDNSLKINTINKILEYTQEINNTKIMESSLSIYMIDKDYQANDITKNFKSEYLKSLMTKYTNSEINQKLESKKNILYILGALILTYIIIYFYSIYYIKQKKQKSFIRLTQKIEKDYNLYKEEKNKEFYSITFVTVSIVIGIIVTLISRFFL